MPDTLMNFEDLVRRACPDIHGLDRWKSVRHMDRRGDAPDLVELFHFDRSTVEFYQAEQGKDVFRGCTGVFSFLGLPRQRAIFFGAYLVRGARRGPLPDLASVPVPLRPMYEQVERVEPGTRFFYDLERDPRFAALEMRVVVDWGRAAISWHQWAVDKPVVELRDPNVLPPCPEYREIDLSLAKLAYLNQYEDANPSWREKLSAVGGIYLLTDKANHRLYVGQAGGETGFWAAGRRTPIVAPATSPSMRRSASVTCART